ncbi:MAG: DUF1015 family protein [Candidatus Latescibacterota bacterium]|nr:DUF1015 family protein [Candidatus Latescibacterota bacterium]
MTTYPDLALQVPRVLLPIDDVDLERWAVIACDQHASSPEYWSQVADIVGDAPSTLELVLPEVYLVERDWPERVRRINQHIQTRLEQGLLAELTPGFVLVDRQTPRAASRKGLLVSLDLEHYSYRGETRTLIRTTEGTDPQRLPPRVEVRRGASIELPHILVLIDDPDRSIIEPLFDRRQRLNELYDTDLMLDGGHVRGWHVSGNDDIATVVAGLRRLRDPERQSSRYGNADDASPMLFAMGDGNHSFATAQEVWEEIKRSQPGVTHHPARYPLVELVNLHDEGLTFEPIHRVVFDIDSDQLLSTMSEYCRSQGSDLEIRDFANRHQWEQARAELDVDGHQLPFIADRRCGIATIHHPQQQLAVAALQSFLSDGDRSLRIDYIHGSDTVDDLGSRPGNIGFYTEVIDKHALFRTIQTDGPLPRKSFSLGEAEEKRYYLEGRKLFDTYAADAR